MKLLPTAVVLALSLGVAPSNAAGAPRFGAYVGCHPGAARAASACSLAALPTAVFRAFRGRGVAYRVCVRRPSRDVKCRARRTGRAGSRSRAAIGLGRPGSYRVTWRVRGRAVARQGFHARAPRVFVDGDSLAVGTGPYLSHYLPGWAIAQSTSISRHAPEGVDLLRTAGEKLAKVIVVSLGTNDDPRATDTFRNAVRESLRIAGPQRCVIWANIVRPPVGGVGYAGYNRILATLNKRRDNLFVVDWASIAARNRSWFGPDGVHPTATGYEVRARAIGRKAEACLDGPLAN